MSKTHTNKVALVTGAFAGIGRTLCAGLAKQGADIIAVARSRSEETAKLVEAEGQECLILQCDVSDRNGVEETVQKALEHFGHIDILINNAGIYPFADIEDLDFETWDRVIKVNLYSQYYMCKAVIPNMKKNGWGRIVNFTSDSINMAIPGISHYMASKMGIIGFTRGLAADVAGYDINVNALGPALTPTPGVESDPALSAKIDWVVDQQKIHRVATVDEYVDPIIFLTSDASKFMTGQVFMVDGGLSH